MADRVALTGWFSFLDGEVTAGDLLALAAVRAELDAERLPYDTFWSPGFRPGGPGLDDARPERYSHLVFVCGPLHGAPVEELHSRFPDAQRIAVGVSIVDPHHPAVTGFHTVLARDAPGGVPRPDLAIAAPAEREPPVVAVVLTHGQGEYGARRRHRDVAGTVTRLTADKDAALLPLDTRLSTTEGHLASTAAQFEAVLRRCDLVVTTRLHGLVLALRHGVPALAVDPVEGGAKVSAQARALGWPAVLSPEELTAAAFDRWWDWCMGPGRAKALQWKGALRRPDTLAADLVAHLRPARDRKA